MSDLLGGLVKGLSGFMPQDDPAVQLMNAQTEVADLQKQETALYADIGRRAAAQNLDQYGDLADRLRLVQSNLTATQCKQKALQSEKEAEDRAAKEQEKRATCPQCGTANTPGMRFCGECGASLTAPAPAGPPIRLRHGAPTGHQILRRQTMRRKRP